MLRRESLESGGKITTGLVLGMFTVRAFAEVAPLPDMLSTRTTAILGGVAFIGGLTAWGRGLDARARCEEATLDQQVDLQEEIG